MLMSVFAISDDKNIRRSIHKHLVYEATQKAFIKQVTDDIVNSIIDSIQLHMMESQKFTEKDFKTRLDIHLLISLYNKSLK